MSVDPTTIPFTYILVLPMVLWPGEWLLAWEQNKYQQKRYKLKHKLCALRERSQTSQRKIRKFETRICKHQLTSSRVGIVFDGKKVYLRRPKSVCPQYLRDVIRAWVGVTDLGKCVRLRAWQTTGFIGEVFFFPVGRLSTIKIIRLDILR